MVPSIAQGLTCCEALAGAHAALVGGGGMGAAAGAAGLHEGALVVLGCTSQETDSRTTLPVSIKQ